MLYETKIILAAWIPPYKPWPFLPNEENINPRNHGKDILDWGHKQDAPIICERDSAFLAEIVSGIAIGGGGRADWLVAFSWSSWRFWLQTEWDKAKMDEQKLAF